MVDYTNDCAVDCNVYVVHCPVDCTVDYIVSIVHYMLDCSIDWCVVSCTDYDFSSMIGKI